MTTPPICGNCTHWHFQPLRDMGKAGFALCSLGPSWEWMSPHYSCKQHAKASEQALIVRRAAWKG